MISIITNIRNQLAMNKLYFQFLKKYTSGTFELIIIDNASTDGSAEFFEEHGAIVIRNRENYSYPHCQNQGIARAKYEVLAFFNNDIIVSKNWDDHLLRILKNSQADFLSFATNDRVETEEATLRLQRKWKRIKYAMRFFFGYSEFSLKTMLKLMYGNWEAFTKRRYSAFGYRLIENFSGSCIVCTRRGLDKLGAWDERIHKADFDLYLCVKKRNLEAGDVQPLQLMAGVFFHHYARLTTGSDDHHHFFDADKIISLQEKWGDEMDFLLKDIEK